MLMGLIVSIVISLIVWISVIVAFANRRKASEFAMMGGKVINTYLTESKEIVGNRRKYLCTDGKEFKQIERAHKHQVIIDSSTVKFKDRTSLNNHTNK